jgi:hypothetical protein
MNDEEPFFVIEAFEDRRIDPLHSAGGFVGDEAWFVGGDGSSFGAFFVQDHEFDVHGNFDVARDFDPQVSFSPFAAVPSIF